MYHKGFISSWRLGPLEANRQSVGIIGRGKAPLRDDSRLESHHKVIDSDSGDPNKRHRDCGRVTDGSLGCCILRGAELKNSRRSCAGVKPFRRSGFGAILTFQAPLKIGTTPFLLYACFWNARMGPRMGRSQIIILCTGHLREDANSSHKVQTRGFSGAQFYSIHVSDQVRGMCS